MDAYCLQSWLHSGSFADIEVYGPVPQACQKTRSLEEETWLAKTDRDGYERWKAIFARSILAWRLYVGVHRTKTAWHEPVETAKADDKLQMMMMMMIDDEKHPKIQQDVAYLIDMTIVLSPSEWLYNT